MAPGKAIGVVRHAIGSVVWAARVVRAILMTRVEAEEMVVVEVVVVAEGEARRRSIQAVEK